MKVGIYAIKDKAAEAFLQPFFSQTDGLAKRAFQEAINNPHQDNNFYKHTADYTLFAIAHFDDETGLIQPLEAIENLGNGLLFQNATT